MEKGIKVIYITNQNEYFHCHTDKTRELVTPKWIEECKKEGDVKFHFIRESHVDLIVRNFSDLASSGLVKPKTLELFSEFGFISGVEYIRLKALERTFSREGA